MQDQFRMRRKPRAANSLQVEAVAKRCGAVSAVYDRALEFGHFGSGIEATIVFTSRTSYIFGSYSCVQNVSLFSPFPMSKFRTPDVEEVRLSRYSVNCRRGL